MIHAIFICDEERFRVRNKEVQRWTSNGWLTFYEIDDFEGRVEHIMAVADQLHLLYGWDISEVNVATDIDDQQYRELRERMYDPASVNLVADDLD